jgi:hypothetical protein
MYYINSRSKDLHVYENDKKWNEEDKQITKNEYEDAAKKSAIQSLKKMIGNNKTVYTSLAHVSSSGMTRRIKSYIVVKGKIVNIDWYIARALGWKHSNDGGIVVGGCGMDMGFHLVYSLSSVIYRRGKKYDSKAAYMLEHKWI